MTGDNFSGGDDSFTETSSEGWLSRLGGAFKGILVGIILFIASFPLLWWNEGRAVRTAKGLESGAAQVVSVASSAVDSSNQGKLVHTTGSLTVGKPAMDGEFSVAPADALKVDRTVEMYQWRENVESKTEKKLGGGTETKKTYSYKKDWSSSVISSSGFKKSEGHTNPASMPVSKKDFTASSVKLGAFRFGESLISSVSGSEAVEGDALKKAAATRVGGKSGTVQEEYIYYGNPASPEVGDVRISFSYVPAGEVSVIGQQQGDTFSAFATEYDTTILLVERGNQPAGKMFQAAQDSNVLMTWLIRIGGIILMFIGLTMILKPLSVLGDVIPIVGSIVGFGASIIAGGISLLLSLITIAIAWIFYRPVLAIILIVAGVAAGAGAIFLKKKLSHA